MLITFKSKASAEFTMYKKHVEKILLLLNKETQRGVFSVNEISHAIQVISDVIK